MLCAIFAMFAGLTADATAAKSKSIWKSQLGMFPSSLGHVGCLVVQAVVDNAGTRTGAEVHLLPMELPPPG
jgi:hypothetical protein